jgi:tRNA threonylcarbamoyladenosine biosynthesis protein TsaE
METIHIENADAMRSFAAESIRTFQAYANAASVIALSGELGAGKTTFVQAVAKSLGVEETVNSPTFVIEKIYALPEGRIWKQLVHIDAYRLTSTEELRMLGWDELIKVGQNLIIIEWPEHVKGAIPESAHHIAIEIEDGEARTISYDH